MPRPTSTDKMNEIKRLRLERGLTQAEMARLCGVNLRTYQRWEEKTMTTKRTLVTVLAVLSTLAGCGREEPSRMICGGQDFTDAPVIEVDRQDKSLPNLEALPACNSQTLQNAYFVDSEGEYRLCSRSVRGEFFWSSLTYCKD
jgi:transcriptional regulator with XRE-family HTH domain